MKRILRLALYLTLPILAAVGWIACSSAPTGTVTQQEKILTEQGLRFPASTANNPVEQRYCAAISSFNMKLSKAHRHISVSECEQLISSNESVCQHFQFCDAQGEKRADLAQNRTRANLLIETLNERVAGPARHIRRISNLKFRAALRSQNDHIGFQDLEQLVSDSTQEQAMR